MFTDFEWCGQAGSLYGLMICKIDSSSGVETVENGANIELSTVNPVGTNKWNFLSGKYTEPLSYTFQVCKNPCTTNIDYFTSTELRFLNRWLNRKDGYHKFKIVDSSDPDYSNIYFNSQLNVKQIEFSGNVIGLEITVLCDAPFGYFDEKTVVMNLNKGNSFQYKYSDSSDEVGHLYPQFLIKCVENGNLELGNTLSGKTLKISNCIANEIINIDSEHKIISSNIRGDDVIKDFNYSWLDIMNTFEDNINTYVSNIPCIVTLKYSPIAKIGM